MMTDFDIANFQATDKQLLAKVKVHQYVSPQVLGTLTMDNIHRIRQYIYPISIEDLKDWVLEDEAFWYWFILPNEQALRLSRMKAQAVSVLQDVLTGQVPDAKLAGIQLKAAQLLLSMSDKPQQNVTKNSLNITGRPEVPKELAKKSTVDLQNEILKLQKEHNFETIEESD
jgi:hypothetical protein